MGNFEIVYSGNSNLSKFFFFSILGIVNFLRFREAFWILRNHDCIVRLLLLFFFNILGIVNYLRISGKRSGFCEIMIALLFPVVAAFPELSELLTMDTVVFTTAADHR